MKSFTIKQVLDFLEHDGQTVDFVGDSSTLIDKIANIGDLDNNCISWIKKRSFLTAEVENLLLTHKNILIVAPFVVENANTIITDNPKRTFFSVLNEFVAIRHAAGIHPTATVETERIGNNVTIGANCYIGPDVVIGDDVFIHHNVVIECPCTIGEGTEIFSGVIIGTDGYGYYKEGDVPIRETHFMGVKIGKHVDIGANTCIDRGLLGDTYIGDNVKIDNLCLIGHNVKIDNNCMVIGGTILCGSATLEKNVYMAPGSILMNQATVKHDAVVGLGSVVMYGVKPGRVVFGYPAAVVNEVQKKEG